MNKENRFLFLIIFFLVPMAEAVDYADQFRQAMDDFTYQMDKKGSVPTARL